MRRVLLAGTVLLAGAVHVLSGQTPGWQPYSDPQKRFSFEHPTAFGTPGRGTDDGFQGRTAALRFPALQGLGGEAVVTSGPITVDVQALGGLYDSFARSVFPDAQLAAVLKVLPPVTPANFCELLGRADHLQNQTLPPALEAAARQVDAVRHLEPVVHRCDVGGGVVLFHKEATFRSGAVTARQHVYGALRFLPPPFSSFQIVRGGLTAPAAAELDTLRRMVASFTVP
jgi:hypothetical protein